MSDNIDAALKRLDATANRIADERNEFLKLLRNARSVLAELIAADDAMSAFIIGVVPAEIGEAAWREEHGRRSARRREATEAARAFIARLST